MTRFDIINLGHCRIRGLAKHPEQGIVFFHGNVDNLRGQNLVVLILIDQCRVMKILLFPRSSGHKAVVDESGT